MVAVSNEEKMVASLIQVDRALESWRDSGFDLGTATGEVIDNSIEAKARTIRVQTYVAKEKGPKRIESIAFADDGVGIRPRILANVLSLGFSTRYNQRNGLGRFGVGLKLAALSHARRVDIWTIPMGATEVYHTFIDLDLIAAGQQDYIEAKIVTGFPEQYRAQMLDEHGEPFSSGTLVVWSKVDRLIDGGRYGTSIDERLRDLIKFIGRAYRKFLSQGITIGVNGRTIAPYDPLFLLENPRVTEVVGSDVRARIVDQGKFSIDGHEVSATVTLYPLALRPKRGPGGRQFEDLYIPENEGKISILRQGREIYYDVIPRMFPSRIENPDRFIGVEVSFPAALDEYFQVRHVKRGAEPVAKLREELRRFLEKPIDEARRQIQEDWDQAEQRERQTTVNHREAMKVVEKVEQTAPRGIGGETVTPDAENLLVDEIIQDLGLRPDTEEAAGIKQLIRDMPITILDGQWSGKELFQVVHLNSNVTVKINHRHPFIREVYSPLKGLADKTASQISAEDVLRLARRVEVGLDVLFMAYAKAESLHRNPNDLFEDLRQYWGHFAATYVREALRHG